MGTTLKLLELMLRQKLLGQGLKGDPYTPAYRFLRGYPSMQPTLPTLPRVGP